LLACKVMADPREIPQLTNELIDMSREYLKQETLEPAKQLGRHAGKGLGGALAIALGAFLMVLAVYSWLRVLLPSGAWWVVLARFLTALVAAGGAALVGWRMNRDYQ
jgi:preprotein translocase subunit SecF